MKLDDILGKIIALTKNIYFQKSDCEYACKDQFIVDNGRPFYPLCGLKLTWWYPKSAIKCCKDIAAMAISFDSALKFGDKRSFCSTIMQFLKDNALNGEFFNDTLIRQKKVKTLFETRVLNDVNEFASRLWQLINKTLLGSVVDWLVLYPLHRIHANSFNLEYDGISFLDTNDTETWRIFCDKYPTAKYWNPKVGKCVDEKQNNFFRKIPPTWLVCETKGTELGARMSAGRLMRKFIGILFSYIYQHNQTVLYKSMAQSSEFSIQFPSELSCVPSEQITAGIGILLHSLPNEVNLTSQVLVDVSTWYQVCSSAQTDKVHRAEIGAQFIQYGMVADGIERFIHFFIALDALFGKRHKVEGSIKQGIQKVFKNNQKWENRIDKIYDLRNELIHGGTNSIDDWKHLESYQRSFGTEPLSDLISAAMTSLRNYFSIQ